MFYNEERPHQALDNETPSQHYAPSLRCWDSVLREPEYDDDNTVRRVRRNGEIKWQGNTIYITTALIGEPIGLREDANGSWSASYGPIALGIIAPGSDQLRKPRKTGGHVDNASALPTSPPAQQQQ